jgi:hypothetical protein
LPELLWDAAEHATTGGARDQLAASAPQGALNRPAGQPGAETVAAPVALLYHLLMDGHRTAERRSLAYHHAIAERVRADPSLLAAARHRVADWMRTGSVHRHYAAAWDALLAAPLDDLLARLVEPSQEMTALRQVSPFAGVLDPRSRWEIWRRSVA